MQVELTDEEFADALDLAQQRHDAKSKSFRNRGAKPFRNEAKAKLASRFGVDPQYMAHFLGVLGEMAWAKVSGDDIDREIYSVRDSGQDFDGVEVKMVTYAGVDEPELKITAKELLERTPPKMYVLCQLVADSNKINVLGTISREDFEAKAKYKRYGRYLPDNYVVPESQMDPVEDEDEE